jgi:hypothetical protein
LYAISKAFKKNNKLKEAPEDEPKDSNMSGTV